MAEIAQGNSASVVDQEKPVTQREEPRSDETYYRVYVDHRSKLYELHVDQTRALDNAILTLAGGAIGVSIVFLEKFASPTDKSNWWILYCAWIALVTSLVLTMLSFLTSTKATMGQIEILDQYYRNNNSEEKQEKWYSKATSILSLGSVLFFMLGIAGLLWFSATQFSSTGRDDERKSEHAGAVPGDQRPPALDSAGASSTRTLDAGGQPAPDASAPNPTSTDQRLRDGPKASATPSDAR